MRLILASGSPRRRELLEAAGVSFHVVVSPVDETALQGETPAATVERLALMKARVVSVQHPEDAVLGADTTVVIDGQMLAKPADDDEAKDMLRRLSGRVHEVLTGVAVVTPAGQRTIVESTRVWVRALGESEIDWYVASGEPRDRAGAYAIQGLASRFIPRIEGSYSNVVGLPVEAVLQLTAALGVGVF